MEELTSDVVLCVRSMVGLIPDTTWRHVLRGWYWPAAAGYQANGIADLCVLSHRMVLLRVHVPSCKPYDAQRHRICVP